MISNALSSTWGRNDDFDEEAVFRRRTDSDLAGRITLHLPRPPNREITCSIHMLPGI